MYTETVYRWLKKLLIQLENNIFRHLSYIKHMKSEKTEDNVLIKRIETSHCICLTSTYGIWLIFIKKSHQNK